MPQSVQQSVQTGALGDQQIHAMQACLASAQPKVASLEARITRDASEIHQAMRLRYKVFSEDMGANLASADEAIDKDCFDDYCHHLIVSDVTNGQVVGYSRILTSALLPQVGSFYSATEFELSQVIKADKNYMEIGRTCVDPDYRSGPVIALLWSAIGSFMADNHIDALMGCASISLADGGTKALAIIDHLREKYFTSEDCRATPKLGVAQIAVNMDGKSLLPPLLKAYLRMGAKVCGEACLDRDFNVADVLILLPKENINQRYMRHFIKQ